VTRAAADRLLDKLRDLIDNGLDDEERVVLAALLAPGVARAYNEAEVEGFGWTSETLPTALADAIRDRQLRIEGL
jgi:hypothetical protein